MGCMRLLILVLIMKNFCIHSKLINGSYSFYYAVFRLENKNDRLELMNDSDININIWEITMREQISSKENMKPLQSIINL
jgi:hypothetical protein